MRSFAGTRDGDIILSDRTPVSVLAYKNLFVGMSNETETLFWEKCETLVERWIDFYDLIFYCQDHYTIDVDKDKRRNKALNNQLEADLETQKQYKRFHCDLQFIPPNLSLEEKGHCVLEILEAKLNLY